MKLEISPEVAMISSFVLACFFVLAVYVWKPIYNPPYDFKDEVKLSKHHSKLVNEFEIKMRSMSVGSLCLAIFLFIILVAD